MSMISDSIDTNENETICENCGNSFVWTIERDAFIQLTTGHICIKCPECSTKYKLGLTSERVDEI